MTKSEISIIIKQIVELLFEEEYDTLVNLSVEKRGSAEQIKAEIGTYPGKLTLPPIQAYNEFEYYVLEGKDQFMVDFYLWFDGKKAELMMSILFYDLLK